MIRAVIDTNVLVSGLISPNGNEALVLLAINQGMVKPAIPLKSSGNMQKC